MGEISKFIIKSDCSVQEEWKVFEKTVHDYLGVDTPSHLFLASASTVFQHSGVFLQAEPGLAGGYPGELNLLDKPLQRG